LEYDHIFLSPMKACRQVFPFLHFSTLQLWIRKGLITPIEVPKKAAGPGSGTKLDIADLTTIGIIYSMLQFGASYKRLEADKINRSDVLYFLEPQETPEKSVFRKSERLGPVLDQSGRQIQEYLLRHKFEIMAHLSPFIPGNEPRAIRIDFYPLSDAETYKWLWDREIMDTYHEVVGHSFINCNTWFQYVVRRL
jgi:hypothetical protein